MARHTLACVVALVALTAAKEQTRWSRQISSYTSDLSDWVPLPGPVEREIPIKRQAVAEPRILAEPVFPGFQRPTGFSQDFPRTYFNHPVNRQLYLQSVPAVPSAPQNYLSDSGFSQGVRFGLAQPNFPLNQGFISPQLTFDSPPPPPPSKPRASMPIISNPIAFPKSNLAPVQSSQLKPFISQVQKKPDQKTIDGYRIDSAAAFQSMKKPQSLQKLKYETYDKVPKTEMTPPKQKSEREEVQLLYVPLDSLNKGHFNFKAPVASQQVVQKGNFNQNIQRPVASPIPAPPKQTFASEHQRPGNLPMDAFETDFLNDFNTHFKDFDQVPKFSTVITPFPTTLPTTPRPKKLKPHQPPLAIFLIQDVKKGKQVKVGDVLSSLKNANSVAVLDSVDPQTAPKVFIGPSNLAPPENFVKFDLPYLSNIDHSNNKLRQLPFFVAPLSYNTPQGFAKIPFPSPHVGSVIINSQIRDTSSTTPSLSADVIPNSYSTPPQKYISQQEQKPITQKPSISFYSTSPPKTNAPPTHQSNYYSFEPQTVSTVRPPLPKEPQASFVTGPPKQPGSYFLSNIHDQQNIQPQGSFEIRDNYQTQPVKAFNVAKQTEPTTPRTTVSSTTAKPSTYPNQLLETHNPYSINQAFHFSTPLDYHSLFDENYATPGFPKQSVLPPRESEAPVVSSTVSSTPSSSATPVEPVTEKAYQTSPNYLQNNYSPEIHYESELANTRYQVSNNNDYTSKPEANDYSKSSPQDNTNYSVSSPIPSSEYTVNSEPQSVSVDQTEAVSKVPAETEGSTKSSPSYYNQYETSYESSKEPSSITTTTTTTTKRTPIRNRGRPRYTTPKADSNESTSRTVVTRKPLRERRPLPPRTRYEPNKITTERATRKPVDSNESTTKYNRSRTRGRVTFKPTEGDENYKFGKYGTSKDNDLAYQRDVLHQNYPVTLMERSSTVDIEAITEPLPRISSTKLLETATDVYDTENAYSYDRAAVSQHIPNIASREESYTARSEETQTEHYVPKYTSSREDYSYQSRSSLAPVEAISHYDESPERDEDFGRQSTASLKTEVTEPSVSVTEQSPSSYSISDLSTRIEETTTTPEVEITKIASHEATTQEEPEENVIQTTPSYNRVRVRPGVVRQYQQASSTESSRAKTRRPAQPVTYRPAFDRRRTTMRIEEIEADLKTKPLHSRPEQDYRHPVYRPDPTTESSASVSSSQEATTKRGVFRRRRPVYTTTTTSTEATSASATTKRTYEVKNRFRGRRPNDRPTTERPEVQTDTTTTARSTIYSRYTRPRLSERYNKKPDQEDSEDQDSNFSINRPKYVEPESDQWSPKISTDSFKPYNPNEIADDRKSTSPSGEEQDIITAKSSDYDDILLTVTPASNNNNRVNKKIPDIPPTLEALVEQSKTTTGEGEKMSTFESMLEEVIKNLEEQDENEHTTNVMKHKGGEIGEIPPERIITSGDNYKTTTIEEQKPTTVASTAEDSSPKEDEKNNKHRRGFWKKVKVRPVTTESIEVAESQYYTNTVNQLGENLSQKGIHEKAFTENKPKITTYKPAFDFIKNIFGDDDDEAFFTTVDIPKIKKQEKEENTTENVTEVQEKTKVEETTKTSVSPGEMDLGTGSPDPTIDDLYSTTPTTEATTKTSDKVDRKDAFSFMDYLFGTNDDEESKDVKTIADITETKDEKLTTTESNYIPEEITSIYSKYEDDKKMFDSDFDIKKIDADNEDSTDNANVKVETSSVSSFMDPDNVVSTSMSTEISHETEICFRGRCIKTSKDIL